MKVIIEEFQESWATDFSELNESVQKILGHLKVSVEHVGSTSVKGLGAKPIIDILIGIESEADLDKTIQPMQQNCFSYIKKYERVSEQWTAMPERRLYTKAESLSCLPAPEIIDYEEKLMTDFIVKSNIHTVVKNTYFWKRLIAFRDYLRTFPEIRNEYYLLKKEISKQDFENVLKYNEAKNNFIKETEKKALIWQEVIYKNLAQ